MKRALIVYATREGQTRKIADHIAATMRDRGREVDVIDAGAPPADLDVARFHLVVLAASVHQGKHEREMVAFVKDRLGALERIPTAFVSVSLSEATVEDATRPVSTRLEATRDTKGMIERFLEETGLRPAWIMPVAGALPYSAYGWLTRLVMRQIAKKAGGPTDTSHDYEMTDWMSLDRFTDELVRSLATPTVPIEGRTGARP